MDVEDSRGGNKCHHQTSNLQILSPSFGKVPNSKAYTHNQQTNKDKDQFPNFLHHINQRNQTQGLRDTKERPTK